MKVIETVEELKQARATLGLSQERLAILLGLSKRQVERIEGHKSNLSGPICLAVSLLVHSKSDSDIKAWVEQELTNSVV